MTNLKALFYILSGISLCVPQPRVRLRFSWALAATLALCAFVLPGCAALPIPLQPKNSDYNSNMAEGTFIVLASVDTLQTTHIRPGTSCAYEADPLARMLYRSRTPPPGRVIGVNLLMITAHTMVASWLDDRVAAEDARYNAEDRYGVGPWYATRFVFHAVSLIAESSAVFNNYNHGCKL